MKNFEKKIDRNGMKFGYQNQNKFDFFALISYILMLHYLKTKNI